MVLIVNAQTQIILEEEIQKLRYELDSVVKLNHQLRKEMSTMIPNSVGKDEYCVQLGITNRPLSSLLSPKLISLTKMGNTFMYSIHGFSSAEEAKILSEELRKLNLNGAFVTKYNNGNRDYNYSYGTSPFATPLNFEKTTKKSNTMLIDE